MTIRCFLACGFGSRVGQLRQFLLIREDERFGVDAISQASGGGPVIENMAEMAVAASAQNLRADHAVAAVCMRDNVLLGHKLEEAGPAGAGVELAMGGEQGQPTADTAVDPLALVVQERAAERSLSALATSNLKLFGCELMTPLRVGLDDACHLDGSDQLPLAIEDLDFHRRLLSHSKHLPSALRFASAAGASSGHMTPIERLRQAAPYHAQYRQNPRDVTHGLLS